MESSGLASVQADDAVLVPRTRQRDQDAFARSYDRYSRLVYSVALRVLRNRTRGSRIEHVVVDHLAR